MSAMSDSPCRGGRGNGGGNGTGEAEVVRTARRERNTQQSTASRYGRTVARRCHVWPQGRDAREGLVFLPTRR